MSGENGLILSTVSTKKDFGRALTARRETAGLTVRDLARKADVPSGTVSGWCTGRHLPTLTQKAMFLRLLAASGVTGDVEKQEWVECWLRLRRPLGRRKVEGPTPYRGLEPFQPEHADWFFGRSKLTETLVERVTNGAPGPMIVVGPSGAGKSSVLRAGLMATLCGSGNGNGSASTGDWEGVLLTPGQHPLATLTIQLTVVADVTETELRARPERTAQRIRRRVAGDLLVVVDQFEEIFTVGAGAAEQDAFLAVVQALSDAGIRVTAGLRADFYPDALHWPLLAKALQDNQVTVGPMTEDELRQAITEPARVAGMGFEEGLTHVLLRDLIPAARDVSALPLLSHALLATWEQGEHRTMTIADYLATGGIHGAIGHTADTVYGELTDTERTLARRLFLRLVHIGDNTPDTRRRIRLEELTDGQDDTATREVLGRFVDRRLVTADADGVEISHEALLHAWPRLRRWIDTDRGLDFHPARPLLVGGGTDLQLYDVTNRNRPMPVGPALTAPPDSDRLVGTVTVSPDGRTVAAASRAGNQVLLWDITTPEHPQQQPVRLSGHTALIKHVTFDHRGNLLASAGEDRTVHLWDMSNVRNPPVVLNPGIGYVFAAEFSPDDRLLVAVGQDGDIALWDVSEPLSPTAIGKSVSAALDDVRSLAISPDGRTLAIGAADGTVRLWDVEKPAAPTPLGRPITGPDGYIHALMFNSDGSMLTGGGAGQTWLWNVTDRRQPQTTAILPTQKPTTWKLQFSPDGQILATASATIQLWDTDPERVIRGICASAGDRITRSEWEKHVPGADYRPICTPS